jgi:dCTP diphosphatase
MVKTVIDQVVDSSRNSPHLAAVTCPACRSTDIKGINPRLIATASRRLNMIKKNKKSASASDLLRIRDELRSFAAKRDWEQFHSPKNLAIALSVEASELLEHFQWLTELESSNLDGKKRASVREEVADVLLYLVRLADRLDVDLYEAARDKIKLNAKKYPVAKARGSHRKYTDL